MSHLARTLAAIRTVTAATSLDELARRLGVTRDDLDAMIGYWVNRGELVVEETVGCAAGGCHGCAWAGGACAPHRSGPVLVSIRPARSA